MTKTPNPIEVSHEADLELTDQLIAESRSSTFRNRAIGIGVAAALFLVGTAAVVWARGQGTNPDALAKALAHMPPLKVEVAVKLDPNASVKLAEGATVGLADGAEVKLADGATVRVVGMVKSEPTAPMVLPKVKPDEDPAIQTNVTVFKQQSWRDGTLMITGWRFANGNSKTPFNQYCYWQHATDASGSWQSDNIAENGTPLATALKKFSTNISEMASKCVWFNGGV